MNMAFLYVAGDNFTETGQLLPRLDCRCSYGTHLSEAGWDPLFVQQQMGHEHASTTSLYTCVASDFRVRTLRRVLDETIAEALSFGEEETS